MPAHSIFSISGEIGPHLPDGYSASQPAHKIAGIATRLSNTPLAPRQGWRANLSAPRNERGQYAGSARSRPMSMPQNSEESQVDYIYRCRGELLKHPECLATANEWKYIQVEYQAARYHVPCRRVTLPSGNRIYTGYFGDKMLTANGTCYHIENLVEPNGPSVAATATHLFIHLLALIGYVAVSPRVSNALYRRRHAHVSALAERPAATVAARAMGALHRLKQTCRHWLSAGLLPTASAHSASREHTGGIPAPLVWRVPRKRQTHPEAKPHGDCIMQIRLPTHEARQLHAYNLAQFINRTRKKPFTLEWYIDFDLYLLRLIQQNFDRASFLTDKRRTVMLILEKKYIEKIMDNCQKQTNLLILPEKKTKELFSKRVYIDIFLENLHWDLKKVFEEVNLKLLRETIDASNGLTFESAKILLIDKIESAPNQSDTTLSSQYHILSLMETAHKEFIANMTYDPQTTIIEKTLYYNNMDILQAIIDNHEDDLKNTIYKRLFYYIFEYNRINDISLQSVTYLIPGEFTEYWYIFSQNIQPINITALSQVLGDEIKLFFENQFQHSTHLLRLLKLIEFSRNRISQSYDKDSWMAKNLWPFIKAQEILEHFIETNLKKISDRAHWNPHQWNLGIFEKIHYDSECLLLLQYMLRLQLLMNGKAGNYLENNINLQAETAEQHLIKAKLYATRELIDPEQNSTHNANIIKLHDSLISEGNIELSITSATYWYLSSSGAGKNAYDSLNIFHIIKEYHNAELMYAIEMRNRFQEKYTSVFELSRSDEMESYNAFFNQFAEYELHDYYLEAKNRTLFFLHYSPFEYIDLIEKPQEVFSFKVYSRKYIQNTLVQNHWVLSPANNIGHITIARLRNKQLALISTLLSAPFIQNITFLETSEIVNLLIAEWRNSLFSLDLRHRKRIVVYKRDLLRLLNVEIGTPTEFLDFFLKKPEKNQIENPTGDYLFIADSCANHFSSVIDVIDVMNEKMLLEMAQELKVYLRDRNWLDYLTSLIPFYEVFWNYWHDINYQIKFQDLIFDIFDLVFSLITVGNAMGKLTYNNIYRILLSAKALNIPRNSLNKFILEKILEDVPSMTAAGTKIVFAELMKFINPAYMIISFSRHLKNFVFKNAVNELDWFRNHVITENNLKNNVARKWSLAIDRGLLTISENGIFTLDKINSNQYRLIQIGNKHYQVLWDKVSEVWRITRPSNGTDLNYAVPIVRTPENLWISAPFQDPDPISALETTLHKTQGSFAILETITFEPSREIAPTELIRNTRPKLNYLCLTSLTENLMDQLTALFPLAAKPDHLVNLLIHCLKDERAFITSLGLWLEPPERDFLYHCIRDITRGRQPIILYRLVYLWRNEHDQYPVRQVVLTLRIDGFIFVIDLKTLRPLAEMQQLEQQVFYEYQWILQYIKIVPKSYQLIKYKDFRRHNETQIADGQEKLSPGKYLKNGYLLREPTWYKSLVVRHQQIHQDFPSPFTYLKSPSVLMTMHALPSDYKTQLRNASVGDDASLLLFRQIKETELLDGDNFKKMKFLLSYSVISNLALNRYLISPEPITNNTQLRQIPAGKSLAIVSESHLLKHIVLSLGDGRFAGVGNNFFDPALPVEPSIISFLDIGKLQDGHLILSSSERCKLYAGYAVDFLKNGPTVVNRIPINITHTHDVKNSTNVACSTIEFMRKETLLTSEKWLVEYTSANRSVLYVTLRGDFFSYAFNETVEMAHIMEYLIFSNNFFPPSHEIEKIILFSSLSGFERRTLRGPILAEEIKIPIIAKPLFQTKALRIRHADWFTTFSPHSGRPEDTASPWRSIARLYQETDTQARRQRFYYLVSLLIKLRKSLAHGRVKRLGYHLPAIYIYLARLILDDISIQDLNYIFPMSIESLDRLSAILTEYGDRPSASEDVYVQCYLDILSSLDEFKHLADWVAP
ncbi:hypothetical protein [Martelella alba]|uniref:Uncharacterized protein n=1 Tax=Martelella alba TaxID=2590451 RepID=A0ABY2SIC4_9HYPH|nr:hypothetical protein [Martelella alba]TKI05131.1 hypothetical protein FCN80_15635 [Martelella alba]